MDLRTRLARLDTLTRKPTPGGDGAVVRAGGHGAQRDALMRELELVPVSGSAGGVFVRRCGFALPPLPFRGRDLVGLFTQIPDPDLQTRDLIFLDAETTGLAGGTGTLAFLVGLAWWDGDRFVVEQVFLADPDRESALLERIAAAVAGRRALVTFNGSSFDLPLLRTRALVNRRRDFLAGPASLDLLVPSRRFWSRSLPDCRQQTLEAQVCGLERGPGDIPGQEIPGIWFGFLRGEEDSRLANVLRHNERDMRGMALVWRELLSMAAVSDGAAPLGSEISRIGWPQFWSLARVSAWRGKGDMVGHWLRRALEDMAERPAGDRPDSTACRGFWRDAVALAKRRRDWPLLRQVVETGLAASPEAAWLHREAAILQEYRLGDLDRALAHAYQCREEGRIARLLRRIEVAGLQGGCAARRDRGQGPGARRL